MPSNISLQCSYTIRYTGFYAMHVTCSVPEVVLIIRLSIQTAVGLLLFHIVIM